MQPIAPNIFVSSPEPRLIGGRETATGRILFPMPAARDGVESILLSPRGALWSYTMQRFRPKSPPYVGPAAFTPFLVGYVELAGEVIVETRICGAEIDQLKLGMEMRLVLEPFVLEDGSSRLSFAFTPAEAAA